MGQKKRLLKICHPILFKFKIRQLRNENPILNLKFIFFIKNKIAWEKL